MGFTLECAALTCGYLTVGDLGGGTHRELLAPLLIASQNSIECLVQEERHQQRQLQRLGAGCGELGVLRGPFVQSPRVSLSLRQ